MGTPDWEYIDEYLRSKLSHGEIDELTLLATGIEGGASYCVVVSKDSVRAEILNALQQIPTDVNETIFSIESTEDCD